MDKYKLGKLGENIAVNFLEQKGYQILERNLRIGAGEIDILAKDKETLVAIEVKTRKENDPFSPEYDITPRKIKLLINEISLFKSFHPNLPEKLRIDFVGIVLDKNFKSAKINLIKNISF